MRRHSTRIVGVILACVSATPIALVDAPRAAAIAGRLDPSFSGDGITSVPGSINDLYDYRDGLMISLDRPSSPMAQIELRARNGDPISTFSENGRVDVQLAPGWNTFVTQMYSSDGKFVLVAGADQFVAGVNRRRAGLIRLTGAGTYDRTFSGDGRLMLDIGSAADAVAAGPVWADASGNVSLLVTVSDLVGTIKALYLHRIRNDGRPVPGFGVNGFLKLPVSSFVGGVEFGPDGTFYVITFGSASRWLISRFLPGGRLDTGFSGDGRVTTACASGSTSPPIRTDARGRLVVFCLSARGMVLTRMRRDGTRDKSFSGDGVALVPPFDPSVEASVQNVAVDRFQRLVVVSFATSPSPTLLVTRVRATGILDTSFDGDGHAVIPVIGFSANTSVRPAASDARIYTAGRVNSSGVAWAVDQD